MLSPLCGELWLVDLNPICGHEQGGTRPCVVISVDEFNSSGLELAIVVPLTTKQKGFPTHVELVPPDGGIKKISYAKCEDIRSISLERLLNRLGRVSATVLQKIRYRIKMIFDI